MHNFARECQSHWRKNFLPHVRYVATIPCESVKHKSNTFQTILALCTCLYRSYLRKPVSMKQTKHSRRQRLKINVQIVHHSREHMHSNDYTTAKSLPRWWCGPAAFIYSLSRWTFFQLLHIMDPRTVDPLVKDTPDAVAGAVPGRGAEGRRGLPVKFLAPLWPPTCENFLLKL